MMKYFTELLKYTTVIEKYLPLFIGVICFLLLDGYKLDL